MPRGSTKQVHNHARQIAAPGSSTHLCYKRQRARGEFQASYIVAEEQKNDCWTTGRAETR